MATRSPLSAALLLALVASGCAEERSTAAPTGAGVQPDLTDGGDGATDGGDEATDGGDGRTDGGDAADGATDGADGAADGTDGAGDGTDGGPTLSDHPVPDFSLVDLNPSSASFDQPVSPRDTLEATSGWYFVHST